MTKDYYHILQVDIHATLSEIKKAYRQLALQYHPDKNSSLEAKNKFLEATEAYEVLKDPLQRKLYDRLHPFIMHSAQDSSFEYEKQQEKWETYGAQKTAEYSDLPFHTFLRKAIGGIKTTMKVLLILYCLIGAISGLFLVSINITVGLVSVIIWVIVGYYLIQYHRGKTKLGSDRL